MLKRRIEVLILAIVGLAILGLVGGFSEVFAISSKNLTLTASVKDALSLALSGNSLDLDLTPTPSGVFRTDNFSATVSTTNQTGYTLYVAATGLDHNDTVTANLVHSSPDVLSVIEPLGSAVVVSRSEDAYTDTSAFTSNRRGLSTDTTTFKPVSTTNNIFDSYEENTSDRVTNFTFGTKVDTNIVAGTYSNTLTITAIANPVYRTFTINYDLDGGEGETIQTESIADEYYPEVTITSTVPTKAHHTFLGYATSEEDAGEGTVTYQPGDKISMDYESPTVELYAVWKAYTYTLVYNANNGTGAPNSQTMTYGENTTISATTPTRTGYTFLGWSLSSTATSATYSANTTYATTTITDAAGITSHNEDSATLYAVYRIPESTFFNLTYMQDMTHDICNAVDAPTLSNLTTVRTKSNYTTVKSGTSQIVLTDRRDNKTYTVRKLPDGKCWMVRNLRYAPSSATRLSATTSDVLASNTWTMPKLGAVNGGYTDYNGDEVYEGSYGAIYDATYYSWHTATAGTGTSSTVASVITTQSICPKGWRLPTGGNGTGTPFTDTTVATETGSVANLVKGDFKRLDIAFGGTGGDNQAGGRANWMNTTYGFNASLLGCFNGSTPHCGGGNSGYWWSSSVNTSNYANMLYLSSSAVNLQRGDYKGFSSALRCVAR